MGNMAVLALGLLLAAISGGAGAEKRIEAALARDIGAENIAVKITGSAMRGGIWSADKAEVSLTEWESGAGRASEAKIVFRELRAVKENGAWKLDSCGEATALMAFSQEDLWRSAALNAGAAQLMGFDFTDDGKISLKGIYKVYMGIPVNFEIVGTPGVRNGAEIVLKGAPEAKVLGIRLGRWADSHVLRVVNPMIDVDDWDMSSSLMYEHIKVAGGWRKLAMENAKVKDGKLTVTGKLKPQ